jgi:hypothetical protein
MNPNSNPNPNLNALPMINNINDWSEDIEKVLDHIRMNSVILSKQHKKRYFYLKTILLYFRLPVIIISGINSIISVGLQPYVGQRTISMMTCLLALACSIIGSIELYLAIQKSMENELLSSKDYYILSIDIHKTLTLSSRHRPIPAKEYLEKKYNEYVKLIENCNLLSKKIIDSLNPLPDMRLNNIGNMASRYISSKSADEESVLSIMPPLSPSSIFDEDNSMFFSTKTRNAGDDQKPAFYMQHTTSVLNTLSNLLHSYKVGPLLNVKQDANHVVELAKNIISNEFKEKEKQISDLQQIYKEHDPLIYSEKESGGESNIIQIKDEEKELLSKSQEKMDSSEASENEKEKNILV